MKKLLKRKDTKVVFVGIGYLFMSGVSSAYAISHWVNHEIVQTVGWTTFTGAFLSMSVLKLLELARMEK